MTSIYNPSTYPKGVPNPYGFRIHPYATRYHGPVYTRPEFRKEWRSRPLNGLGGTNMEVNTRGGLFGGGGYGGGVFDGSDSMSGVGGTASYPMPVSRRSNPALGITQSEAFPWGVYSKNTEHLQRSYNLWAKTTGYCQISEDGKLGPTTCGAYRVQTGNQLASCKSYNTPQKCGEHMQPSDPHGLLWGVKTGETAAAQFQYNVWARDNGYCPISADGKLGAGTCGALRTAGGGSADVPVPAVPSTCQSFTAPSACASDKPVPPAKLPPAEVPPGTPTAPGPVLPPPEPYLPPTGPSTAMLAWAGAGVVALGVGAFLVFRKKKGR